MTPSHRARKRTRTPKRPPRDHYDTQSYGRAIADACKKGGVSHWAPNRLRHSAATRIKNERSLEAARALLGHSTASTTEIYAEIDEHLATETMANLG